MMGNVGVSFPERPGSQAALVLTKRWHLRNTVTRDLGRASWPDSLDNPTGFYLDCFRYFHQKLPKPIREHREYFQSGGRGFGEDAFHVMWFLLFQEFKPRSFLEIGVYRGQTLSLAALLARTFGRPCNVCGVSPFSPAGDSVTRYRQAVDYHQDTLDNFAHFDLPKPALVRALSTDPAAVASISGQQWDMIYIDGNHDYEIACRDWELCSRNVKPGGIIVLDDSGLTTRYRPPFFATGGHPGPSRLAAEIDRQGYGEILQVGHNRVFERKTR